MKKVQKNGMVHRDVQRYTKLHKAYEKHNDVKSSTDFEGDFLVDAVRECQVDRAVKLVEDFHGQVGSDLSHLESGVKAVLKACIDLLNLSNFSVTSKQPSQNSELTMKKIQI